MQHSLCEYSVTVIADAITAAMYSDALFLKIGCSSHFSKKCQTLWRE